MLLITLLTVHDAVSLLQCSQRAKYTLHSYLGAINFALTRPCFNGIGSPLTLAAWQYIWQACADFAESAGLDVGVWSHAAEIAFAYKVYTDDPYAHRPELIGASRIYCYWSGSYAYLSPQGLFTRMQIQTLEPLITMIIQRAQLQIDLASVLLLKGYRIETCWTELAVLWEEDMEFAALAVALDMTFVHIRCALNISCEHDVDVKASIHVFNHPMHFAELLHTDADPLEDAWGQMAIPWSMPVDIGTCHDMPFWNVQNVLLSAFQNVNSLSISKRDFHLNSTHDTWSDLYMNPSVYGTILHSMAHPYAGGQIRRVARDSIPYTCMEFIQWYGWDLGRTRWNEASPWSVNSTRLAEVLRQSRAPGITRLQASYTERPSAFLESILEYQFDRLC